MSPQKKESVERRDDDEAMMGVKFTSETDVVEADKKNVSCSDF